ncbi:MAG TPA: hypothetical protein VEZ41_05375 [Allosphingosinicella sp.]|nr:hypothetical protein [Allosphingosinicella sp.]
MTRMIKDYVEIGEFSTLDEMISRLAEIRDNLPPEAETELRIRGDAVFGRHLCVGFMRPLTSEEAACEGRYHDLERRLKSVA